MAQIKNIKKPGDLIRGAKVGVAGLDKDGNVIGTGIAVEDVPVYPEGAQVGDVLAWGGDTGAEWRPHYPESGSEGDVLTLGETGPEWSIIPAPSTIDYTDQVVVNLGLTVDIKRACRIGKLVNLTLRLTNETGETIPQSSEIVTVPADFYTSYYVAGFCSMSSATLMTKVVINNRRLYLDAPIVNNESVTFTLTYAIN